MSHSTSRQKALEQLRAGAIDLKTYNRRIGAIERAEERKLVNAARKATEKLEAFRAAKERRQARSTLRRDMARSIAEAMQ